MTFDTGSVIAGLVMAVSGIVWLVRLEGRIDRADDRHDRLRADILEIKQDVKALLVRPHKTRAQDA